MTNLTKLYEEIITEKEEQLNEVDYGLIFSALLYISHFFYLFLTRKRYNKELNDQFTRMQLIDITNKIYDDTIKKYGTKKDESIEMFLNNSRDSILNYIKHNRNCTAYSLFDKIKDNEELFKKYHKKTLNNLEINNMKHNALVKI